MQSCHYWLLLPRTTCGEIQPAGSPVAWGWGWTCQLHIRPGLRQWFSKRPQRNANSPSHVQDIVLTNPFNCVINYQISYYYWLSESCLGPFREGILEHLLPRMVSTWNPSGLERSVPASLMDSRQIFPLTSGDLPWSLPCPCKNHLAMLAWWSRACVSWPTCSCIWTCSVLATNAKCVGSFPHLVDPKDRATNSFSFFFLLLLLLWTRRLERPQGEQGNGSNE